ncbi:LrgB family protein [Coraliomargarita algicola]|uniref:LrgB family protein n=1 Tax=Coraliomargarita algicola TaxID=3092156 RepID=A0ABZ0RKG4_9BACT|nr:LrgB family protein [Coraliomargarita sp. J2-16]WPJ95588.1 LrgB family protein [Coraliomargarita sp. J2-16]
MIEIIQGSFWCACTLTIYLSSQKLHRTYGRWWSSPMLVTWAGCGILILALHANYREYLLGTNWMIWLLGPATVAFAIPIYRQQALIQKHWLLLCIGVAVGSLLAFATCWGLAAFFHFSPEIRASLLPRSVTTPLAMEASSRIGGVPELTAIFTAITGLFGAAIGESLLCFLPIRSSFARGALFGMGAHGAGVAKAREIGQEEGVVASLIMILAGLLNVLLAGLISSL